MTEANCSNFKSSIVSFSDKYSKIQLTIQVLNPKQSPIASEWFYQSLWRYIEFESGH